MNNSKVNHLAIIMDGNGRWAKKRGYPRIVGHKAGVDTVRKIILACRDRGIKYLSLYAFSTENWNRPITEVSALMNIFRFYIRKEINNLRKEDVRVLFAGSKARLSRDILDIMNETEKMTAECKSITVIGCLNYGGKTELVDAVNAIVEKGIQNIDESVIDAHLYQPGIPSPDLLVRTSGELRLSNFLIWQTAYSELYFTDVYWPDFDEQELDNALASFASRDRRFGGVKQSETLEE